MRSFQTTVVCSLVFAVAAVQGAGRRDENKKQMILNGQIHMKGQSAWPICEACVPKELIEAPGIGFDLNTGYATAAIKYHNGTVVDVCHLEGGEEYIETMRRFSFPYVQSEPPFDSHLDYIKYGRNLALRRLRRLRGLPSTPDIEVLASLLSQLKTATSKTLNATVSKVLVSTVFLPNLKPADYDEAFAVAGLEPLHSSMYNGNLMKGNAAWAGMGHGFCKSWRDLGMCMDENNEVGVQNSLLLQLTDKELVMQHLLIWDANRVFIFSGRQYPDLGFAAWEANTRNETFWESVSDKVLEMATLGQWDIDELLLLGDRGEEKLFLDAVWRGLSGERNQNSDKDVMNLWRPLQTTGFSAEFVAARGAAELAMRWQGQPWGCIEDEWCDVDEE